MDKTWVNPEELDQLGYELLSEADGFSKYHNKAGIVLPSYGIAGRGKRIIYFNTTYSPQEVFVGIKEDGDTRIAFNGAVTSKEEFLTILKCSR